MMGQLLLTNLIKRIFYVYCNCPIYRQMVDKEKAKCDVCGKSFYSRKQLEQHTQDSHSTVNKNDMAKPVRKSLKVSNKVITIIGAGILVAIIGGVGVFSATAPDMSRLH